jgi:hypothetical protein
MKQHLEKRKAYEHPMMLVIKLRQKHHLLTVSSDLTGLEDYGLNDYFEE